MTTKKIGNFLGLKIHKVAFCGTILQCGLLFKLITYLDNAALSVHSGRLWLDIVAMIVLFTYSYRFNLIALDNGIITLSTKDDKSDDYSDYLSTARLLNVIGWIFAGIVILIGIAGLDALNASSYSKLISYETASTLDDIPTMEDGIGLIALMDSETAQVYGKRALSSLDNVISRYDLSSVYTQITYKGKPMKVCPLEYASLSKWINYKNDGIPGYVLVDPVNYTAEYIECDEPIMYSPSNAFGTKLKRHLRKQFPNEIFGTSYFEIDDTGVPYWTTPIYKTTVGVFGGKVIDKLIVTDASDGNSKVYGIKDIPEWVDVVFDGDYISENMNYALKLKNGFWNSIFAQTDCKKCTDDFGYITLGNDIGVYTGITSLNNDSSNVGVIIANERTGEVKYYSAGGADESSAMAAAEGEVANFGYHASFPSLVKTGNELSYVMVLKDDSNIIKKYAMVNLHTYSKLAVGDTLQQTYDKYIGKLSNTLNVASDQLQTVEIIVKDVKFIVNDGNTTVYITADNNDVFKTAFNEYWVFDRIGQKVRLGVATSDTNEIRTIYSLNGKSTVTSEDAVE